jgi:hypothetical protein
MHAIWSNYPVLQTTLLLQMHAIQNERYRPKMLISFNSLLVGYRDYQHLTDSQLFL